MYNYNNENNNERSTRQFMEGILNGDIPVRRQNPRPGQSEYYYLHGDTENNDVLSNGIEIDVPNPYTPNPMKMQAGQTMANPSLSPTAGMNNPFGNRNSAYTGATGQAGANSMPGVGAYAQTGQAWGSMGQSGMNGNMFSGYQPYDERNGNAARMAQGYGNGTAQAAGVADQVWESGNRGMQTGQKQEIFVPMTSLEKLEALSSAGLQGLTLGFEDEIEGACGALGTGAFAAYCGDDVLKGFENGYVKTRDARRAVLERGRQQLPVGMFVAEMLGAVPNLAGNFVLRNLMKVGPGASSRILNLRNERIENYLAPLYGIGSAEGGFTDHAEGAALGWLGHKAANILPSGALTDAGKVFFVTPEGRKVFSNAADHLVGEEIDRLYDEGEASYQEYF